jgi:hypothetical protein
VAERIQAMQRKWSVSKIVVDAPLQGAEEMRQRFGLPLDATEKAGKKIRRGLTREEQGMARNVGKKSMSTAGEILFWLKKEVYQNADASVLPTIERLTLAGREAMVAWLTPRTPTSITVGGVAV